jgi:hypothetical protein
VSLVAKLGTCFEERRGGRRYLDEDGCAGPEAEQEARGDEGAVPGEPGMLLSDNDCRLRPRISLLRRGGRRRRSRLGLGRRRSSGGLRILQRGGGEETR